jgi:hypothetical protein
MVVGEMNPQSLFYLYRDFMEDFFLPLQSPTLNNTKRTRVTKVKVWNWKWNSQFTSDSNDSMQYIKMNTIQFLHCIVFYLINLDRHDWNCEPPAGAATAAKIHLAWEQFTKCVIKGKCGYCVPKLNGLFLLKRVSIWSSHVQILSYSIETSKTMSLFLELSIAPLTNTKEWNMKWNMEIDGRFSITTKYSQVPPMDGRFLPSTLWIKSPHKKLDFQYRENRN